MTPVELIALAGCGRPEDGRGCPVCLAAAEVHVRAVEDAGLTVVSTDDLRTYLDRGANLSAEIAAMRRLRAALPERTERP